jgi:hypothetical protein
LLFERDESVVEASLSYTALTRLGVLIDEVMLGDIVGEEVVDVVLLAAVEVPVVIFVDMAAVVRTSALQLMLVSWMVRTSFTSLICSYEHLAIGPRFARTAAFCDSLLP